MEVHNEKENEKGLHHWLTIGELAQRSDVSVPAIRFYEEKELIWSTRTQGNQRRYQRAMLRRVAIIKIAQQVGISLQQVKDAFQVLPKHQVASKADWQNMSQTWQAQLDQQIINLLKLRQQLDKCIGCGCLSLQQCPLRNPDDQMGQESAGAHFQDVLMNLLNSPIDEQLDER
ncbi:redox-sensitive transcriptional activator SoxR [Acinetobacter rongchengensis]|uniref:Redox-sensitive transcriptional activator SoxR n=1 Tax=Acinetobacter rongchengensis TaxID=2419601 RepID=A0A3A8F906_9GAMM|nr:redox-sensitive transcriptional activator SoxR [Acinetobacter rongchengensis]RKG37641.1 redox-sensitive transcriptional activator SoxR [Acinetobacter rongchengensis]